MDRARALASFWSWLPAFRAVAETEHLPTAARALHVTPSALSRSIRLLEDALGERLFERTGRRLRLNAAGEAFLATVRDAMRLVDEGQRCVRGARHAGPVVLSAPTPLVAPLLHGALRALRADEPGLLPVLTSEAPAAVPALLLAGELDLALVDGAVANPALHVERLGLLRHGVFAGPGHALAPGPRPDRDAVLSHPFVAPPPDDRGVPVDAWPPHFPRNVTLRAARMQLGIDACLEGGWLAVLPVAVGVRAGLVEVPFDPLPETPLHLAHRRTLPVRGRTERIADAIRASLAAEPPAGLVLACAR